MSDLTHTNRQVQLTRTDLRRAYMDYVARMRREMSGARLRSLLAAGRVDEMMNVLAQVSNGLITAWTDAYVRAGKSASSFVNADFNQFDDRVVRAIRQEQQMMLQRFAQQQLAATRASLIEGLQVRASMTEQIRLVRDSFGLALYHRQALSNYRRGLEQGGSAAVSRDLRDKRFDVTAQRGDLTTTQVDRMAERYRERLVAHRADTLAETEARTVVYEATHEAFQQAVDDGMDPANLQRQWRTRGDGHVRGSHSFMNGQVRDFGEPFTSGNGSELDHPGDSSAPAEDRVNCRCDLVTDLVESQEIS